MRRMGTRASGQLWPRLLPIAGDDVLAFRLRLERSSFFPKQPVTVPTGQNGIVDQVSITLHFAEDVLTDDGGSIPVILKHDDFHRFNLAV